MTASPPTTTYRAPRRLSSAQSRARSVSVGGPAALQGRCDSVLHLPFVGFLERFEPIDTFGEWQPQTHALQQLSHPLKELSGRTSGNSPHHFAERFFEINCWFHLMRRAASGPSQPRISPLHPRCNSQLLR